MSLSFGTQVQWLIENFDMVDGTSMPRATLYALYMHHCSYQKLEPMNRASFGKLIRSVFVGLQTRRLGGRYCRCPAVEDVNVLLSFSVLLR